MLAKPGQLTKQIRKFSGVEKDSEVFLTTERHKGKKNLRSSSHKLLKKTQKNEKSQQLGSFQNNEIARLNKEKLDLEAYVVYLESKIKNLETCQLDSKKKKKLSQN